MSYSFDDVGSYLGLYFHTVYYKKTVRIQCWTIRESISWEFNIFQSEKEKTNFHFVKNRGQNWGGMKIAMSHSYNLKNIIKKNCGNGQ